MSGCGLLEPELGEAELRHLGCGKFELFVRVRGLSGELIAAHDGRQLMSEPIRGTNDHTLRFDGRIPAQPVTLTVAGKSHVVFPPGMFVDEGSVHLEHEALPVNRADRAGWSIASTCLEGRDDLTYQLLVHKTVVARGPVPPDGVVTIPVPEPKLGPLPVAIALVAGDIEIFTHHALLQLGPPCLDVDGDGVASCDGDCDDDDPAVHPGADEVHGNRKDDDCDGVNGVDRDGDGFEAASVGGRDCADQDPAIHPDALEWPDADGDGHGAPNGIDDNCNGRIDEGTGPADCDDTRPDIHPGHGEWADADGDGYGAPNGIDDDCDGRVDESPGDAELDCDDANPAVNPGHPEAPDPNRIDDDCDGVVDEGTIAYDDDGDGLAELEGDCDDGDPRVHPNATELPNCRDDDCDDAVDEGITRPERDDPYEDNGSERSAYDLGTGGTRSFYKTLHLVTAQPLDEEWFEFYSQDGPFDMWAITARVDQIGQDHAYELSIVEPGGHVRARGIVSARGDQVRVGGKPLAADSGIYFLQVRPSQTAGNWCPLTIALSSN